MTKARVILISTVLCWASIVGVALRCVYEGLIMPIVIADAMVESSPSGLAVFDNWRKCTEGIDATYPNTTECAMRRGSRKMWFFDLRIIQLRLSDGTGTLVRPGPILVSPRVFPLSIVALLIVAWLISNEILTVLGKLNTSVANDSVSSSG